MAQVFLFVKKIIEHLGGKMWLKSKKDKRTTFFLY